MLSVKISLWLTSLGLSITNFYFYQNQTIHFTRKISSLLPFLDFCSPDANISRILFTIFCDIFFYNVKHITGFPCHFYTFLSLILSNNSLVAQRIKHLPATQETRVRSLGWEDPLEKEMATHSSTLVWRIPWTEEPGRLQSTGWQRVGHDWATSLNNFHGRWRFW